MPGYGFLDATTTTAIPAAATIAQAPVRARRIVRSPCSPTASNRLAPRPAVFYHPGCTETSHRGRGKIACSLWQALTGDIRVLDGLKKIGP